MRRLSAAEVMAAWEAGTAAGAVERPLAVLAACLPERDPEELAALPLGERDGLLAGVHAAMFGTRLEASASCPRCQARVEFALDMADLWPIPSPDAAPDPATQVLHCEGVDVEFRLPTSRDLLAITAHGDVDSARTALLERCVISARGEGGERSAPALPDAVVAALSAEMARRQPWSDIEAELRCPDCDHAWQAPLDAAEFVWAELAAEARRLLHDVDTLARAYGWREADILGMSGVRRAAYLELVG